MVDHSDDSLINFKSNSGSKSDLFKFFKKGFDQNSQVEFDSSGLLTAIRVNVLDSDGLRNEFDDFD